MAKTQDQNLAIKQRGIYAPKYADCTMNERILATNGISD
jgi:hypothetical protein